MFTRRYLIAVAAAGTVALGAPGAAQAQDADYPNRPITIIVGFSAGGPSDTYARLLAEHLEEELGQPVVVENRPGASTMLAGGHVAQADPDGYTLFFNTNSTYIPLFLYDDAPYDADAFEPIGLMHSGAAFIVAPPDSQFDTLQELIEYARENPDELNYSTTGLGGYVHLTGEYFADVFDAEVTPVNYGGGAEALQGVMSGEADFSFIGAAAAVPQIHAGRVKALAVTEPERIADLPDVPTVDEVAMEMGMDDPDWDTGSWYGLLGPAGIPEDIVNTLNAELVEFVGTDEIRERHAAEGNVSGGDTTPQEFRELTERDSAIWQNVIESRNVTVE